MSTTLYLYLAIRHRHGCIVCGLYVVVVVMTNQRAQTNKY